MEIGILNSGSPVDVGESSCDDLIVSSVCNVNRGFVNINLIADLTSGHYDLLYRAEDIPDHVETNSLNSISDTDPRTDLRQLSAMNMMSVYQPVNRIDLSSAFGDTDINSQLVFPDGQFNEPRTNIRPETPIELIPGWTVIPPDASSLTDRYLGGEHVFPDTSMPLGFPPDELGTHQLYNTSMTHELNPDSELVETSLSSKNFYNTISTSPLSDDGSLITKPMRV